MKFYRTAERSKPFSLGERLRRLLTFGIRFEVDVESGVDLLVGFVVFGQGVTLGFTRSTPHILAGFYSSFDILTERFTLCAGWESDAYSDYEARIDTLRDVIAADAIGCSDACCPNEADHVPGQNVCGCVETPAHVSVADLSIARPVFNPSTDPVGEHGAPDEHNHAYTDDGFVPNFQPDTCAACAAIPLTACDKHPERGGCPPIC